MAEQENKKSKDDDFQIDESLDFMDDTFSEEKSEVSADKIGDLDAFFDDLSNLEGDEKKAKSKPAPPEEPINVETESEDFKDLEEDQDSAFSLSLDDNLALDDNLSSDDDLDSSLIAGENPSNASMTDKSFAAQKERAKSQQKSPRKSFGFPFKKSLAVLVILLLLIFGIYFTYQAYMTWVHDKLLDAWKDASSQEVGIDESDLSTPDIIDEPNPILVEPQEKTFGFEDADSSGSGVIHSGISGNRFVQVATCSYKSCLDRFSNALFKLGYLENDLVIKSKTLNSTFMRVYLNDYYENAVAKRIIKKINRNNDLGLNAYYRTNAKKQTRIFITIVPNNQEAENKYNKIDAYLSELFRTEFSNLNYSLDNVIERRSLKTQRMLLGPYETDAKAQKALKSVQSAELFAGAFIKVEK